MSQVLAHSLDGNSRTKDVAIVESVSFESLLLSEKVLKGLTESGFKKPSPIQLKSLPIGRCGFDLIVKSKSGTGKTVVFSVIALENIDTSRSSLQGLILAPTREIAVQIQDVIRQLGSHIEGLKVESFIGGLPLNEDKEKCKICHIAVGSPGRIKHMINEGIMITKSVRLFVLDEADKLMESSFRNDINEIYNNLPAKKQIITTSATYSKELEEFLSDYMCSPTHVTAELETPLLLGLKQFIVVVDPHPNVVQQMRRKTEELLKLFSSISFTQCIVFSNYQTRAESISNLLNQKGWNSTHISAAQTQNQRLTAVNNLKNFKCRIMLSTDLTARGIDAANVDLVINYDIPFDPTTYLHRMGRAGRYGSFGVCINLVSEGSELRLLEGILGHIGGSALSIPKLPTFTGSISDLLEIDVTSQDHIFGKTDNISNSELEAFNKNKIYNLLKDTKELNNGDKVPLPKESGANSDIMSILNETKNEIEEVRMQISSMDTQSILESLASQQFNMNLTNDSSNKVNSHSILQCISSSDTKNDTVVSEEKAKINNILHTVLNSKGTEHTTRTDFKQPCKDQLFPVDSDGKKREETFTRNMALLNVSKILDEPQKPDSDSDSIQKYLNDIKKQQLEEVSQLSKKSISDILETLQDVRNTVDQETQFDIENIFKFGYNAIVRSNDINWKKLMEDNSDISTSERVVENYDSMEEEYTEEVSPDEVEVMKWVPVNSVRKTKIEETDCSSRVDEVVLEEYVETGAGTNKEVEVMKWIPVQSIKKIKVEQTCMSQTVERDHENYEHFQTHFNNCGDQLWQNGMTFDNVNKFDEWFHYEWEAQLYAVRNYVQQNIYVQEMNKYQNNVMKK
ncbi:hypothetical protein JTB14_021607 [Gonioctena quinquepunctata]|nr:hypothetical protein JTB14_021607 [Gonioctena quinquepunctata]